MNGNFRIFVVLCSFQFQKSFKVRKQIESEAIKCNDCASSSDLFAPSSSSHPPPEAEAESSSRPQLVKAKMAKFLPIGVRSDVMKHRHFYRSFQKNIWLPSTETRSSIIAYYWLPPLHYHQAWPCRLCHGLSGKIFHNNMHTRSRGGYYE